MRNRFFGILIGCAAMALLPLRAKEVRIDFDKGTLDAAAEHFTALEKPVKFPEAGEIEFEFKPQYGLEKKFPQRKVLTYSLLSARTAKGGFNVGINVIPEKKQTVIYIYGWNPGDDGRAFSHQSNFPVAKGQWCRIVVRWNAKKIQLLVDGKLTIDMTPSSFLKNFRLELPDTILIGGAKHGSAARGEFRNFVIRDIPAPAQTVVTGEPAVTCLEIRAENEKLLHLVAESHHSASKLTVRPSVFPVVKGKRYFVDFSNAIPYEVTAEKDGELVVEFPHRYRSDMTISPAQGGNLLKDGSFEGEKLDWQGGKIGETARSGKQSLKLTLEKFGDSVSAVSPKIALDPAKEYFFTVFYCQKDTRDDTMFGTTIFLSRDDDPNAGSRMATTDYEYNNFPKNIDSGTPWHYARLKVNIPADWKKGKVSARVLFRVTGHPGTVFFDDADFRIAPPTVPWAGKEVEVKPAMDEKQLQAFFAAHPGYRAKVVRHNDAPALSVNGRIVPPIPMCSWNSALAATAREQGVEIIMLDIPVNFYGVKKRSVWQGKDRFDFSLVDQALKEVLQHYPEAKVIVKIGGVYNNFCEDVPNSKWVTRDGKFTHVRNTAAAIGFAVSLISDEVRRECGGAYRKIAEHIAASPYGKAVIGCKFTFGGDGQWYPAINPWNFKHFDYSEGSRLSVCSRIRQMYGNDLAALRKAWGDDTVTFDSIRMPAAKEFEVAEQKKFLDPANPAHRRLMDCMLAYHREVLKSIETFCTAFKEGMGKDVITGVYYTSNSGMCHEELLRSDKVDFFATLGNYMRPRNLGGSGNPGVPLGSVRLHDKLFFEEMDFRNDYSNSLNPSYRVWLGVPFDASPKNAFNQLRRSFGAMLTQGESGWFMTMGQRCKFTWYGPYAPIMKEVTDAFRGEAPEMKEQWPGMIFFHDEKRPVYYTMLNNYDHASGYLGRIYSAESGVAAQHYYLSDLIDPRLPKSKLYIFADTARFSEEQLRFIEKNLQKDGNVLVFFNDAGALSAGGFEKVNQ